MPTRREWLMNGSTWKLDVGAEFTEQGGVRFRIWAPKVQILALRIVSGKRTGTIPAYGNALLSRFPLRLLHGGALPTLRGLRRFEKRGALWGEFRLPHESVQVITTHFGLFRRERLLQVQALLGPEWLGHPECRPPLILCGDFNASPHSRVYARIIGRLRDVQRYLAWSRPKSTWPARHPVRRIDHMFISPDFTVEEVAVPQDNLTRMASDHLPLIAAVNLRGSGERESPR